MEWEGTLDSSRMIEALSDDTLIFHQVHKRVWPSAQRDTCLMSHIRNFHLDSKTSKPITKISSPSSATSPNLSELANDYWIVINHSIEHDQAPIKDPVIRAWANVAMICSTEIQDAHKFKTPQDLARLTRDNVVCKIIYVAQVNPGGWVPANVLRTVYKREYPKFLKRFTQYVIDKTKKLPILY
jgi:collagen type IV alpha-3-binding protein